MHSMKQPLHHKILTARGVRLHDRVDVSTKRRHIVLSYQGCEVERSTAVGRIWLTTTIGYIA